MSFDIMSPNHQSNDKATPLPNAKNSHPSAALLKRQSTAENLHGRVRNKLGTINGCFVPCLLNIMGIILFLRLGWGVGHVGVGGVFLALGIAEALCIVTVLSLCAILTNGTMRAGGPYYMISRTLGPAFGGSIGILFYAAYCVCVAFYASGFAEAVVNTWFDSSYWILTAFSSVVLFYCLVIALMGANCFTKINVILFLIQFIAIFVALIAFFARGTFELDHRESPCPEDDFVHYKWTWERFLSMWHLENCSECVSFAVAFGVLFPATTGIMDGANLSGDLANPSYSIPVGTLSAIFTSIVFYIALIIGFAGSFNGCTMRQDTALMQASAWGDVGTYLVVTGIIISASSSTLGSLFSGSRVLQAIARDKLFPYTTIFEYGTVKGDEPRTCVLITWAVAQGFVFVGGLNVIARISTAFFCLAYATVNLACFLLTVSGTPNFRPSFKVYSWPMCFIGTIANLIVMFYVDWIFGIAALVAEVIIFIYLSKRQPAADAVWGDVTQSVMFHQVRKYLLRLDERKAHSKSWRPSILMFPDCKYHAAIDFCNNLKKGGLYIIGVAVHGEYGEFRKTTKIRKNWIEFISSNGLKAFPQVTVAPDIRNAMENLVLLSGLGALQPNTVILPMIRILKQQQRKEEKEQEEEDALDHATYTVDDVQSLIPQSPASMNANEYTKLLRNILRFNKNIILTANFGAFDSQLLTSDMQHNELQMISPHKGLRKRRTMGSEAFLSESLSHSFVENVNVLQPREEAQWIDVWLFASDYTFNARKIKKSKCDEAFPMLIMQLSHILMRNRMWKRKAKVKLRVLIIVNKEWNESDKANFDAICKECRLHIEEYVELQEPSKHPKVEWEEIINGTKKSASVKKYYKSLNSKIKALSEHTYFTFIQLPRFPSLDQEDDEMDAKLNLTYYQSLYVLLRGLPPTALCRTGEIEPVISIDL